LAFAIDGGIVLAGVRATTERAEGASGTTRPGADGMK
jgi:hypothetical protein